MTRRDARSARDVRGYSVRVSDEPDDAEWDDFLEQARGSAYTQTSCWGRARVSLGWRSVRVVVSEDDRVVAGAQIETRALPIGGLVGFVFGGPVVGDDRPELVEVVLHEMMAMGKANKVRYLAVQPSRGDDRVCAELARSGFRRGVLDFLYIYHPASAILDLRIGADELAAKMSTSRRRNIRWAEKRGVTVRRGSEVDLPVLDRLEDAHAARLGYARREDGYYTDLWRALAAREHVALFIAEYEGAPVCAQLAIPFGDTSYHLERPWSGEHRELRATDVVEWEAIRWAKSEGYSFVDLGGIDPPVAEAVLSGTDHRDTREYGASLFKLRWGGQIITNPPFLDYVYNPVLRLGYRCVPRRLMRSAWMERLVKKLKETGS
ncbi:MAG TPA: peptidoglycan bridge formation glycyltransferase FemA/FemB family protein [Propionibacteriaceae bacterium]